jgi:sugar lactone lactonase YvrE
LLSSVQPDRGLEMVVGPGAELAEGPCWDSARQELIWVDIPAGVVHGLSSSGRVTHDVGRPVGVALPVDHRRLLVARQGELSLLDRDTGGLEAFLALEPGEPEMRPNDGKCDPAGRLWISTTRMNHDLPAGTLYRVGPDGTARAMVTGLWCGNGLAWSPDASVMFFTDSTTRRVDRFAFHLATGDITDRDAFVAVTVGGAVPDGMCVDSEGGLWVALWGGGCVQRFDANGRLSAQIDLPVPLVTSCCFGGPRLADLYVTTARHPDGPDLGGAVFRCDPGVTGQPVDRFRLAS